MSALSPIVREAEGAWIGWSGSAGRAPDPFLHDGIQQVPVPLSADEVKGCYQGVCNRTLWPLYHDAIRQPEYHRHWWKHYVAVNDRFAEAVAAVAAPRSLVWVHDYHLQLVPARLRRLRPDLRIGFFLHIPFPPNELFARIPWRTDIVEGILGADVIGFQTPAGVANFRQAARRFAEARARGRDFTVGDRHLTVDAYPISIDVERFASLADSPDVVRQSQETRRRLGQDRKIILGVDRLDYTKGIDLRLKAFRELLVHSTITIRDAVLVQVAVPSRERITEYAELRNVVESLVGQINGEFAEVGTAAVHYLRRTFPFEELVSMYRAADVMLVTPLCDGMNLVAKEYVATHTDADGVLILSEFAGSASELRSAIHVNPHDLNGLADGIVRGLHMTRAERTRRMRSLRRVVINHDVHAWADSFLRDLKRES